MVDEVSMIDADFFDLVEYIARRVRGNYLPFGGITLILSGDFLQLPPVQKVKPSHPQPTTTLTHII